MNKVLFDRFIYEGAQIIWNRYWTRRAFIEAYGPMLRKTFNEGTALSRLFGE